MTHFIQKTTGGHTEHMKHQDLHGIPKLETNKLTVLPKGPR